MTLVEDIYALTKSFPREERFGLTSQLRKAAGSIRILAKALDESDVECCSITWISL